MHRRHLDLLVCPRCPVAPALTVEIAERAGDDILSGALVCRDCAARFPIRSGIPRFVDADAEAYGNFDFQWKRWRTVQIDRLAGHNLSERRFIADARWPEGWLTGKLVLDAGCGAGRFADIALAHGATVVACEISGAVEACAETVADHGSKAFCLQASITELPFRPGTFDGIYCMGVIQHTPDPKRTMRALPPLLKPGGRLFYNFYERGLWPRLQWIKYALRLVTPHLPPAATLALSRALVSALFPLTRRLARVRYLRAANILMPICAVHFPELDDDQQRHWTLLDTFDWYGPRHEHRQDHRRVRALLEAMNLAEVDSAPGLAWGRRPDAAAMTAGNPNEP